MPEESPTRFVMVPARRSSEPAGRRRARRILGALFLASGLSIIAIFVALAKGRATPDLSTVDPKGRDLAYAAAVDYLNASYENVPHATTVNPDDLAQAGSDVLGGQPSAPLVYRSLSWVGFTPEHFGSRKTGFTDFETHHFLVVLGGTPGSSDAPSQAPQQTPMPADTTTPAPGDSAGPAPAPTDAGTQPPKSGVLQLDVPVLITPQGPRLAAAPAFSAWAGGTGGADGTGDYTNFGGLVVQLNDTVKNQIATWVKAYVTGDAAGLLAITGDQNPHHHYVGLSGFNLPDSPSAVQVLSAITVSKGQLVVRVRVLLARSGSSGTVSSGSGATQEFVAPADFDLLVGAPTGAQPPILAWGPAGSAAELEPYSNALTH